MKRLFVFLFFALSVTGCDTIKEIANRLPSGTQSPQGNPPNEQSKGSGGLGNCCFKNNDINSMVSVVLKKRDTGEKVGEISISGGDNGCIYKIPADVYSAEISWQTGLGGVSDRKQILVEAGQTTTTQLNHTGN